jgi:uncharacterized protein with HEPN domain
MTTSRDFLHYLQDMVDMMRTLEQLTAAMDFEQFEQDQRTKLAVTKAIEIMGEAAKNVPGPVRKRHPNIPWKQMAGMRDRLSRGYFGIDYDIVWKTATQLIPALLPQLADVLGEETRRERGTGK